jgi:CO dehydrogenase nickel-insertion accessory protein CooC1
MTFDELCDHLEFSMEHGGFDPDGQGGCSCPVCTFLRNFLQESQIEKSTHKDL